MRLIPILAAATICLFATAAMAQNMNTRDPNSAPGASQSGGKPTGPVNRSNTADPNSAPGASATGGRPSGAVNRASTADPNSASTATGHKRMAKKHSKKKKHHSM